MQTLFLPYQEDISLLFAHFVHLPNAIFLDSCGRDRYDIFSAEPIAIIESDVFSAIKKQLNSLEKNNPYDLPFTIGAMGYLSYDIGRTLEKIPSFAKKDIDLPDAFVGIYDWSIVADHHDKKIYFNSARGALATQRLLDLLKEKPKRTHSFKITSPFQPNISREDYNAAFHHIKQHILEGDCYQVNLTQRFSSTFSGDPWIAYQTLRQKNPAPFSAFMKIHNDTILSASPERFIKIKDKCVETKPIKGTSKRFNDPIKDKASADQLCHSEKDRAENTMIVDLLRNDLSKTCEAGSVQVPKLCTLESFANVHHLVSTITAKIKAKYTALDVLQHCFPGGSITGAPKIAAMKIIETLEANRRAIYCGSIFYLNADDTMDSNIAIRTVICDNHNIHCYAGGGIVYDSACDSEYEECVTKIQNILKILCDVGFVYDKISVAQVEA